MSDRKIADGRYTKRPGFYLDYDNGGYTNSHGVFDADKDTGISICETGHSNIPGSHKRSVSFQGKDFPTLREAIYAYEDGLSAKAENVPQ